MLSPFTRQHLGTLLCSENKADLLVLTAALTDKTRGMLSRDRLSHMPGPGEYELRQHHAPVDLGCGLRQVGQRVVQTRLAEQQIALEAFEISERNDARQEGRRTGNNRRLTG